MGADRDDSGLLRDATARWDGTLDKTLRAAMIPYGYTATLWATGAFLITNRGRPSALETFVFLIAALAAFATLATISQSLSGRREQLRAVEPLPIHPDSSHPIFLSGLHIIAAGTAFAGGLLVESALGNVAWFLGPFTVTILYLALSSFELALAAEVYRRKAFASLRLRRWAQPQQAPPVEPVVAAAESIPVGEPAAAPQAELTPR